METKQICACHKIKQRSEEESRQLIHRLNRIEGQIRGIRGMVEKNVYCTDILMHTFVPALRRIFAMARMKLLTSW